MSIIWQLTAVECVRIAGGALLILSIAFVSALVFAAFLLVHDNKFYLRWWPRPISEPLPYAVVIVVYVIYSIAIWTFVWLVVPA